MEVKKKGSVFKILFLLGVLLSLVGCSGIGFDTNKMIQAPQLSDKYRPIQEAIEKNDSENREILLVSPQTLTDSENSAIKIKDDLAIVSFKYANEVYSCVAILQNKDNKWTLISEKKKPSCMVDMMSFVDFNGDGDVKVIVSWVNNSSLKSSICVYNIDNSGRPIDEMSSNSNDVLNNDSDTNVNIFNNFTLCDINNDGKVEVIVFFSSPAKNKHVVRAYSFNEKFNLISECDLQDEYVKYFAITIGLLDNSHIGIFLDGDYYDSNEYFCTDAVYWDNGKLAHISRRFFDKSMRFIIEKSRDIDKDGIIEVPNIEEVYDYEKYPGKTPGVSVIWKKWSIQNDKGVAVKEKSYIYNNYARYAVMMPDKWFTSDEGNAVRALIDLSEKNMVFYEKQGDENKTPLFEIKIFTKDDWKNADKNVYSEITLNEQNKKNNKNENLVYAVKYLSDSNLNIPLNELGSRFLFL